MSRKVEVWSVCPPGGVEYGEWDLVRRRPMTSGQKLAWQAAKFGRGGLSRLILPVPVSWCELMWRKWRWPKE